jgi:hypothetical protein
LDLKANALGDMGRYSESLYTLDAALNIVSNNQHLLSEKAVGLEKMGMCSLDLIFVKKDLSTYNRDLIDNIGAPNVKDDVNRHKCG